MADISDDVADWSATAASNSPSGATTIGTGLDDNLRAIQAAVAAWRAEIHTGVRGAISGLIQSQAADTDHDTTLSVGGCRDSTNAQWINLASALTKRIDAAWSVGTNQGGLDGSESVGGTPDASTWYYIWLIMRSDTGVVDALYSESATAPTMPSNYDFKRLVGAVRTDGSANIVAYTAYETEGGGIETLWTVPTLDVNLANTLTTSRRTDTVKVPVNFSVEAHLNVVVSDASTSARVWVCCPDQTDAAPSDSAAPLQNLFLPSSTGLAASQVRIRTSATGTIAARSTLATVDFYGVSTMGFKWARRN